MSKRLVLVGIIGVAIGAAVGYMMGVKHAQADAALYIATAGHTKTYVSIARLLRNGNVAEALRLADSMIDVGASWLADVPAGLDDEAKSHVTTALSAIEQYRPTR